MDRTVKKWLFDILLSIERIDTFIGSPKLFDNYQNNIQLQQAVERNLEIIGEAMSKILNRFPEIAITQARKIVDTRNKIIHGYDEIEPENIWAIIINHLPVLKQEVEKLLTETEKED